MLFREIEFAQSELKPNNFLVVTGVSAVGKDFLLKKAKESNPDMEQNVQIVDFGSDLFKLLKRKFNLISRDQIASLLTQDQILDSINELVESMKTPKPKILNTHIVYKQNESLNINTSTIRRIDPSGYLYVWADPDEILYRRTNDSTRIRHSESIDEISLHQDIAQSVVESLAKNYGASMKNIYNCQSNVLNNVQILFEQLESVQR